MLFNGLKGFHSPPSGAKGLEDFVLVYSSLLVCYDRAVMWKNIICLFISPGLFHTIIVQFVVLAPSSMHVLTSHYALNDGWRLDSNVLVELHNSI